MKNGAIVGSKGFSNNPTNAELARFAEIAESLGTVLAEHGHEIVVCSDSDRTADRHAVQGANETVPPDKKVAVSLFVSHQDVERLAGAEPYGEASFPNISRTLKLTGGWFSTYDAAAAYSDAVIALGGSARGTGAALYTALARRKPVVGIPACGGAAKDIWRDTEGHYDRLPPETRLRLTSPDPKKSVDAAVDAAEYLIRSNPFPRQSPVIVYALFPTAMLAFGAGWVFLSHVWDGTPGWKPYAVALLMAGPGMLLRYVQDSKRNEEAYFGAAKVLKDAARVLGLLLLAFLFLDFTIAHTGGGDIKKDVLLAKTLALVGFAVGFIVEDMSELLTSSLRTVVRGVIEGKK